MEELRKTRSDSEPAKSGLADRLRSSSGSVPAPPLDDEDVGSRLRALASADTTDLERLAQRKRAGSIRPHAGRAALGVVGAVLWTLDMLRRGLVAFARVCRVVLRACGLGLRRFSRGLLHAAVGGARRLRRTSVRTGASAQTAVGAIGGSLQARWRALALVTASCVSVLALGYGAVTLAPRGVPGAKSGARQAEAGMTEASASASLIEEAGMRLGAATHRSLEDLGLGAAQPEPAATAPVTSKYVLEVRTDPPGATVLTDRAEQKPFTTPGRLELDSKPGVLFVGVDKRGYRPVELRINGAMFEPRGNRNYHLVELKLDAVQRVRRARK